MEYAVNPHDFLVPQSGHYETITQLITNMSYEDIRIPVVSTWLAAPWLPPKSKMHYSVLQHQVQQFRSQCSTIHHTSRTGPMKNSCVAQMTHLEQRGKRKRDLKCSSKPIYAGFFFFFYSSQGYLEGLHDTVFFITTFHIKRWDLGSVHFE